MNRKRIVAAAVVCMMACAFILISAHQVHAALKSSTSNLDKGLADKKDLDMITKPGEKDKDKGGGATTLQMVLGFGSIFVMIAVVKWL